MKHLFCYLTPAKYKQVLKLFNHIQSFLIDTLQDLGADIQAKDVAQNLKTIMNHVAVLKRRDSFG